MFLSKPVLAKMARAQIMDTADPPLIALVGRESEGRASEPHHHPSGQLLGLFGGLLTVRTGGGAWVVPATRAVWIPPSQVHSASSHGPFHGWSVYVRPDLCATLPSQARAMEVSGLLREAVIRAASWELAEPDRIQKNVVNVILDEIGGGVTDEFRLPMPWDGRLLRIAHALIENPADPRSLDAWASWANAASRTISRRFQSETGLSFTRWRQRVRMLRALELLAAGRGVSAVALDLGYDNASAFIALFRKTFNTTPGRYLAPAMEP